MEAFYALLTLCTGNSLVAGEFPSQIPVTRIFDVFFDLHMNKRLSERWRRHRVHYDVTVMHAVISGINVPQISDNSIDILKGLFSKMPLNITIGPMIS